jgi:hypothetical protein
MGIPVEAEALAAEIAQLHAQLEYALAENQVWRELIAEMRELITSQVSQAFPNSRGFDRIRRCMAEPRYLEAEVTKVVERDAAALRAKL